MTANGKDQMLMGKLYLLDKSRSVLNAADGRTDGEREEVKRKCTAKKVQGKDLQTTREIGRAHV